MTHIDISMPLAPGIVHWPGEEGFQRTEKDAGEAIVSSVQFGSHTGTHIDAPKHFVRDGGSLDNLALDALIGDCMVAEITHAGQITEDDIVALPKGITRVIFKTSNTERGLLEKPDFEIDFVSLDESAAQAAVAAGLQLIGVDYLSVEKKGAVGHPVHNTLLQNSIIAIEGCWLKDVVPGEYHLTALPLRITDGDASPARVVLTTKE